MDAKIVKRYRKKSLPQLIKIATTLFNKYIRKRDEGQKCISCDNPFNQAGHYYSGGHYPGLKFNEDNTNGQCLSCNYYKHGNLIEYRKKLIQKIGLDRVEKLDRLAAQYKRKSYKWDKITVIEIIQKYKTLNKS